MSDVSTTPPSDANGPAPETPAPMATEEMSQFDIIKRQFRKNRAAVWGLLA